MTALINSAFPQIAEAVGRYVDSVILIEPNINLQKPVASHADMNVFRLKDTLFVAGGAKFCPELHIPEYNVVWLDDPGCNYPEDVICNAKLIREHMFCNLRTISDQIVKLAAAENYKILDVRQGYTGCSICVVTDSAMITSDTGIADVARANGFDVLLINNNEIKLPGYDVGFIGGCTGLLDENRLFLSGCLSKCSFGSEIKTFCAGHGVEIIELTKDSPVDVGGILIL